MDRLRVLITNTILGSRSGTETYVRDLALGLLERGHTPIVYSTQHGEMAAEIRKRSVPVVDDLATVSVPPDIIHGHHHPETMTALLRFPTAPAIFVCHDRQAWYDAPPRFPRIRRYVAIDDNCRDRLWFEHGIPEAETRVLLNSVDVQRFRPRGPLPPQPRRAAIFNNYVTEGPMLDTVRAVCAARDIALDVIGVGIGNTCPRPEAVLGQYDLVFAKARCALEALAVGAAVILCDSSGRLGPLVTSAELDRLRRLNFGQRTLSRANLPELLEQEIARYDPADTARVAHWIRQHANRDDSIEELLCLYREVLEEHRRQPLPTPAEELAATAAYLRSAMPYQEINRLHTHIRHIESERRRDLAQLAPATSPSQDARAHGAPVVPRWHRVRAS